MVHVQVRQMHVDAAGQERDEAQAEADEKTD